MTAANEALSGDELLAAVTEAMVGFHQRYYHREPVSAKTMLLGDDLLACVLGGVYTDVEKTMIEIQRSTLVQETRNAFQTAMQDKFINTVQNALGPPGAGIRLQPPRRPRHRDRAVLASAQRNLRTGQLDARRLRHTPRHRRESPPTGNPATV